MTKILIIDDERAIRSTLKDIIEYEGFQVLEAQDGPEGLEIIRKGRVDLVLCDIKMPKMDGMEVLAEIQKSNADLPVIMISGHGTVETAVEATRLGAYDFIAKPPDLNRLLITIRNALERGNLVTETKILKQKISKTQEILGDSSAIQNIRDTIDRVAPTDARVLVTGENGTGKELVARWIHEKSNRAKGPLIEVNCAAIPAELIESELFGHEKGSFTSAIKQRIGFFEQASGGTLFLDEIGDMPLSAQAKVLRALQEHKITRVGGEKEIKIDVRVIAATNKDLVHEIENKNFRLDLYHRLSVIMVHVPSLNDRRDDIPVLAERFLKEMCNEYNLPLKKFSLKALDALKTYNWSGNIRELRNVIERLTILCGEVISEEEVSAFTRPLEFTGLSTLESIVNKFSDLHEFKDFVEREFIERKLKGNNWNITKTAEEIGIQRSHLYNKIEKYGFNRGE